MASKDKRRKKRTGVVKNVIQDQKGCKKNKRRDEEEQITAVQTKQHEDKEEDTGIRPRKKQKQKQKQRRKNRSSEECDARSERLQEELHTC